MTIARVLDEAPTAVRIFVSGAATHAGKSTTCLGILAFALAAGVPAEQLAYIKPATQDERVDTVARWCEAQGIECCSGAEAPIVFYAGFTRAFISGEAGTSEAWLERAASKVGELCQGRKLVVIDGVGFPGVGSVVGCSNADVAAACQAPVLLVAKSGLGGAIDSVSLCATYFKQGGVPVLGTVLNDAPTEGFYSKDAILPTLKTYFERNFPSTRRRLYGVTPRLEELQGLRDDAGALSDAAFDSLTTAAACHLVEHVDILGLLSDAASDPWNRHRNEQQRQTTTTLDNDPVELRRRTQANAAKSGATLAPRA